MVEWMDEYGMRVWNESRQLVSQSDSQPFGGRRTFFMIIFE